MSEDQTLMAARAGLKTVIDIHEAMSEQAKKRTSLENVYDVLMALVKVESSRKE